MAPQRPATCERARTFVSLRLDGELPELQQRMLDAHLAACAACSCDALEVAAFTDAVRATPLEPVEPVVVGRFVAPARARLRQVGAVAAALLMAVGVGGVVRQAEGPEGHDRSERAAWPVPRAYLSEQELLQEQVHISYQVPGNAPRQKRF